MIVKEYQKDVLQNSFLCNKHIICIQFIILCSVPFSPWSSLLHTPFHPSASCAKLARQ